MKNILLGVFWIVTFSVAILGLLEIVDIKDSQVWLAMYRWSLCYAIVALVSRICYKRKELNEVDISLICIAWVMGYVVKYVLGGPEINPTNTSVLDIWSWVVVYSIIVGYGTIHAMGNMYRSIKGYSQ